MGEGFNRVVLFGNLGVSPELRKTPGGQSLLKLKLATNHSYVNREGTREDRTDWHHVTVWGPRADGLHRILHKGSFLLVEGHLRTRSYEKDGQRRYMTEVHAVNVILGGRCGPSGHAEMDPPDDADRIGDMETLRDDSFDPQQLTARREQDSEPPPRDADVIEPALTERPPRGSRGDGGAPPPAPPPPRKKARPQSQQTTLAA